MIGEYFCIPRENLQCFYITKENVKEFLDKYGMLDGWNKGKIVLRTNEIARVLYDEVIEG